MKYKLIFLFILVNNCNSVDHKYTRSTSIGNLESQLTIFPVVIIESKINQRIYSLDDDEYLLFSNLIIKSLDLERFDTKSSKNDYVLEIFLNIHENNNKINDFINSLTFFIYPSYQNISIGVTLKLRDQSGHLIRESYSRIDYNIEKCILYLPKVFSYSKDDEFHTFIKTITREAANGI
ncbi:hypothetical protein LPTSP4_36670 [Leptospira ryugenii]|uniref:Uncharacterized protein n=1 Tax=Leptospira ryugenii TaxID=1917863 RepID=A0A2P2E5H9_9LEPT|nr:hypothetical protein [Leptospira ryugenii]GBF52129.1 hypothetical protein LPTSP4_36670 [Leptospira ryugenii]